jgi:uncharacterized FAD-dependent dehydrogenase
LEPKPFAVGVRVELPQEQVDAAQYGRWAELLRARLGAASFRLTRKEEDAIRRCYSFCMCPGGEVIACASSEGQLTTNGMSRAARDLPFANAAFLVPVTPDDFPELPESALGGVVFQEMLEEQTFRAGGGEYALPAARLGDFLAGQAGDLPELRSCRRAVPADLKTLLPPFLYRTLSRSIPPMLEKLEGLDRDAALIYASETRSSSPVRVLRNSAGVSTTAAGLYPCGEGAGYAGGIVSSAIDGMKAAESYLAARDRASYVFRQKK